jgi:hypothetical protein
VKEESSLKLLPSLRIRIYARLAVMPTHVIVMLKSARGFNAVLGHGSGVLHFYNYQHHPRFLKKKKGTAICSVVNNSNVSGSPATNGCYELAHLFAAHNRQLWSKGGGCDPSCLEVPVLSESRCTCPMFVFATLELAKGSRNRW